MILILHFLVKNRFQPLKKKAIYWITDATGYGRTESFGQGILVALCVCLWVNLCVCVCVCVCVHVRVRVRVRLRVRACASSRVCV